MFRAGYDNSYHIAQLLKKESGSNTIFIQSNPFSWVPLRHPGNPEFSEQLASGFLLNTRHTPHIVYQNCGKRSADACTSVLSTKDPRLVPRPYRRRFDSKEPPFTLLFFRYVIGKRPRSISNPKFWTFNIIWVIRNRICDRLLGQSSVTRRSVVSN